MRLNASAGHKVVPAAIRNDGDKAEPPPSSACLPNTGPTLTTSIPLKFSSASWGIAAFRILESRQEDLARNVNRFTLDQPGPAHHFSKQQKIGDGPMALYRATATVIFGNLAIGVSSVTRLCGCCAQAGSSHFKSRAGSSGSTTRRAVADGRHNDDPRWTRPGRIPP